MPLRVYSLFVEGQKFMISDDNRLIARSVDGVVMLKELFQEDYEEIINGIL